MPRFLGTWKRYINLNPRWWDKVGGSGGSKKIVRGSFYLVVGSNDDDAYGYHKTGDGSDDYGSIIEKTNQDLKIIQFRYLEDGSKDLRLRFKSDAYIGDDIVLSIMKESDGERISVQMSYDGNRYIAFDDRLIKWFSDGETLEIDVNPEESTKDARDTKEF